MSFHWLWNIDNNTEKWKGSWFSVHKSHKKATDDSYACRIVIKFSFEEACTNSLLKLWEIACDLAGHWKTVSVGWPYPKVCMLLSTSHGHLERHFWSLWLAYQCCTQNLSAFRICDVVGRLMRNTVFVGTTRMQQNHAR